jgi:hypothetical protein
MDINRTAPLATRTVSGADLRQVALHGLLRNLIGNAGKHTALLAFDIAEPKFSLLLSAEKNGCVAVGTRRRR